MSTAIMGNSGSGKSTLAYSVAGTGNRLDANPVDAGENTGRLSITLRGGAGRDEEDAAMQAMRGSLENMPGVQYRFSRPSLFSMSTPLEVVVSGYDLERLAIAAEAVRARMAADERFADVKTTMRYAHLEQQVVLARARDVIDRVNAAVAGER